MEPHNGSHPGHAGPAVAPEPVPDLGAEPAAAPPGAPARPAGGNESVAAALHELATVAQRPLPEHPDTFARVHAGLQQALSDIDDA